MNLEESVDGSSSTTAPADRMLSSLPFRSVASKKDEKLVRFARATVMLVLFVSGMLVATLAYVVVANSQASSFRLQFESSARQVMLMANRNAANVFVSFQTMAAIYPSTAKRANVTLPFLTIDGFSTIAAGFLNVSKASLIHFSPLLRTQREVEQWNSYSAAQTAWVTEGRHNQVFPPGVDTSDVFARFAFDQTPNASIMPSTVDSYLVAPAWQMAPLPPRLDLVNYNAYQFPVTRASMEYVAETGKPSLTEPIPALRAFFPVAVEGPISLLHFPVYNDFDTFSEENVVGFLSGILPWKTFLDNTLPAGDEEEEVLVVVDSCTVNSTFLIQGPTATFVGDGSLLNDTFKGMSKSQYFVGSESEDVSSKRKKQCKHLVHVFPTKALHAAHVTNTPVHYAVCVVSIFCFSALIFLLYDYFVSTRQSRTERQADTSNAIVQELFPGDFAQKIFAGQGRDGALESKKKAGLIGNGDRKTIAELYPEATVLFADIAGFTAWGSTRDPHQVFTLLESIFQAFDVIAKRYCIFKVETIGDCYVAACGVPKYNPDHAVVMSRFARAIMVKFCWVVRSLELTLGPDTGELSLRVGMHSGPVTAGVLRGERARFQLFGDTVNTASRLESTGKSERVHISEQTALLLVSHGKEDWITKRDDMVEAKGKGKLITYWLKQSTALKQVERIAHADTGRDDSNASDQNDVTSGSFDGDLDMHNDMQYSTVMGNEDKNSRLAHWNSDLLIELLQRIVSRRVALQNSNGCPNPSSPDTLSSKARAIGEGLTVVQEVVEIIDMPDFVCTSSATKEELDQAVVAQLRGFVSRIASMYNDNPFHNFEHASHVAMSVHKLLGRIVAPKIDLSTCPDNAEQQAAILHDHTCGITSDPLTQFAVVLAALIHDLDHPGVSNGQLMKEEPQLAARYKEKSVAEQNSIDLAWGILLMEDYDKLRATIFATETELNRFRHLLVNSIIATDIFDKDLSALRKNRWNKAFYETTPEDSAHEIKSRKATIVIEHLLQASDVAHTMQHWHVYQKWNQRLFDEMMVAYRADRSDKDPSEGWYSGELWFFDNYVIPLAKKLKDCGVFGVSSDEYLNYALHNRDEWKSKGKDVVHEYLEEFNRKQLHSKSASPMAKSVRLVL